MSTAKRKPLTDLTVYNFNINEMKTNWQGWVPYIADQDLPPPDVILLQDIPHNEGRKQLVDQLRGSFGGSWDARGNTTKWQASILWRTDRFGKAKHRSFSGWGHPRDRAGCIPSGEGFQAVQVRLFDKKARKWISVASFKTPGRAGEECVPKNMALIDGKLKEKGWDGSVVFMGTDANQAEYGDDRKWKDWYRSATILGGSETESLGYTDPTYEASGGNIDVLQQKYRSLGKRRVDYLLFKKLRGREPQMVATDMLPRGRGKGSKWSDHRSIYAQIRY